MSGVIKMRLNRKLLTILNSVLYGNNSLKLMRLWSGNICFNQPLIYERLKFLSYTLNFQIE